MQCGWRGFGLVLAAGLIGCGSTGDSGTTTTAGSGSSTTEGMNITITTSGASSISETSGTSETSSTTDTTTTDGMSTTTDPSVGTDSTEGTGGTDGTGETTGSDSTGETGGVVELGPGSLQFIGVNSDLPEGFALVALTNIPSGTELRFTERAWNEDDGVFEVAEGTATLVLNTNLSAGTVFEVGVMGQTTLSVTPSIGTITTAPTGNWGIAGNGDNLFVYLGPDDDPTFIAGTAFSSPSVWTTDSNGLDGQSSMIPASLSEAAGTITTFSDDNLRYTGARTGEGSIAAYLPLIADETNYETGNAAYTPLRGTDFAP